MASAKERARVEQAIEPWRTSRYALNFQEAKRYGDESAVNSKKNGTSKKGGPRD